MAAKELRYEGSIMDKQFAFQQSYTLKQGTHSAYVLSFSCMLPDLAAEMALAAPLIQSFSFID